jgi:hypothetical protein
MFGFGRGEDKDMQASKHYCTEVDLSSVCFFLSFCLCWLSGGYGAAAAKEPVSDCPL